MSTFACNPADYEKLPWVDGCEKCARLRGDPQPGLFTWIETVAEHFDGDHGVTLVGA